MNPTSLFNMLKITQKDFDTELVDSYKRLSSGAIEMTLKSGNKAVFRIDPDTKKKYFLMEWE